MNFKYQGFFFPMIASLFLLPCFVAYFLKSEFDKEKGAIALEHREKTFEAIFSKIDTASGLSSSLDKSGSVRWVKDTIGAQVSYTLTYVSDSLYTSEFNDMEIGFDNTLRSPHMIKIRVDDSIRHNQKAESNASYPLKREVETIERIVRSNRNIDTSELIELQNNHDNLLEIVHIKDADNNSFIAPHDQIENKLVIKRITPQILFSSLLLGSVWLSFFMIARSLRKERQLAELRNDFMSNMSHELKTPVSTIGVALEALSNFDAGNDPALRNEYINISKIEVERLGMLVDKALNISLYEQGKFVYDKQDIDINVEIEKVIKTLRVQLDNHHVQLDFQKSGNNFIIGADRTHMINVIHNLIENAIKYSDEPADINIFLEEDENDIEIRISDKGRGIHPEFQDKVFDKFFRVPQGNTHNVKGHGLGLSYVKEVIESQGGHINLKSGEGAGSTFIIRMAKSNHLS